MNKFLIVSLGLILSIACTDTDKWEPGPQPAPNNPGVYFNRTNPRVFEMDANTNKELVQDFFTVSMGRDKNKVSSDLQVPIIVRFADSNVSIPQFIKFEAGSAQANLNIKLSDFKFATPYNFSIEIDENYSNPYRVFEEGEEGGSSRIDAKVEVGCLLSKAIFTPKDYSGEIVPEFVPFEQRIYDNLNGTYTIKNFLYNNSGYRFSFKLDEKNNILPTSNSGFNSLTDNRWYFYSANSINTVNQIPCYLPGNNPADYVTYIYFYTLENTTSDQAFWLDLENKKGRMVGYSHFSVSSSGRIVFDISW